MGGVWGSAPVAPTEPAASDHQNRPVVMTPRSTMPKCHTTTESSDASALFWGVSSRFCVTMEAAHRHQFGRRCERCSAMSREEELATTQAVEGSSYLDVLNDCLACGVIGFDDTLGASLCWHLKPSISSASSEPGRWAAVRRVARAIGALAPARREADYIRHPSGRGRCLVGGPYFATCWSPSRTFGEEGPEHEDVEGKLGTASKG